MVQATEHAAVNVPQPTNRRPRIALFIAAVVAIGVWWAWFGANWKIFVTFGSAGPLALLLFTVIAALLSFTPPITQFSARLANTLRSPTPTARRATAVAIAILSTIYLAVTANEQSRPLYPVVHDEFSYLIGAQMLAHGRLWMHAHPLHQFFDSFQLIVDPVYASAYFPGTALMFAPAVLAHIPPWLAAAVMAGVVVALLYLVVTRLIDGSAGLLAALLLLSAGMFRTLSVMVMSQAPVMLLGLIAILAWLNWRETQRARWAWLLGVAGGWAFITRPIDAVCLLLPICIAMLFDTRDIRRLTGWGVIGVVPFLLLQLISNQGITGHLSETPFRFYADRDHPLTSFGFHHYEPGTRPLSDLPQKQDLYLRDYVPLIEQHSLANVPSQWWPRQLGQTFALNSSVPFVMLIPLALIGFAVARPRDWIVLGALPLFAGLYACYVFFLPHYPIILAPAVIVGILLAVRSLPSLAPRRYQSAIATWLTLMLIGLAIAALPQWDSSASDEMFDAPLLRQVNTSLASLPANERAVVLFKYDPNRNVHEEPVYNAGVAWPDEAQIIRAHDRGNENQLIYRYYAEHQPDRFFYQFDEATKSLKRLGSVTDLVHQSK
jgi:hypothetical protein